LFSADKGGSNADVRTFWEQNIGFFEINGVSAQTRGSIFRAFMDGPRNYLFP